MSVIEIKGLTKHFGKTQALAGVDLSVEEGEVYGFIGPNGAGKSTTIRCLLGIIRSDAGTARIFGRNAWRDAVEIHRNLAYVPGDVNLWPNLTGGEVIDLFVRLRKAQDNVWGTAQDNTQGSMQSGRRGAKQESARPAHDPALKKRRAELIERFDFDPAKKCGAYSKGNRQKVALIAAFASNAQLLILDEPTSGLDPLMEQVFRECVAEQRERGATVLLSSHILSEVEHLCERISIIRQGKIIDSGTLAQMRHLTRNKLVVESAGALEGLAALEGVHNVQTVAAGAAACAAVAATASSATSASATSTASGTPTTPTSTARTTRTAQAAPYTTHFDLDNAQTATILAYLASKQVLSLVSTPPTLEELFMSHYAGGGSSDA